MVSVKLGEMTLFYNGVLRRMSPDEAESHFTWTGPSCGGIESSRTPISNYPPWKSEQCPTCLSRTKTTNIFI